MTDVKRAVMAAMQNLVMVFPDFFCSRLLCKERNDDFRFVVVVLGGWGGLNGGGRRTSVR